MGVCESTGLPAGARVVARKLTGRPVCLGLRHAAGLLRGESVCKQVSIGPLVATGARELEFESPLTEINVIKLMRQRREHGNHLNPRGRGTCYRRCRCL